MNAPKKSPLLLQVKNLHASVDQHPILKGLNLEIRAGEIHAIMGPNGAGKSTLSKVIAGHPSYHVTQGEILYDINLQMRNILELDPDVRAKEGIFLGFQYPVEVPGVNNEIFLRTAFNSILKHQGAEEMSPEAFKKFVQQKMELLQMNPEFLNRSVNTGFSGGEKKKNEILQLAVLSPRLVLLDETDSGLDIDALKNVASGILKLHRPDQGLLLVTHYKRLLNLIKPHYIHVLVDGRIVETGGPELADQLEARGYDGITA